MKIVITGGSGFIGTYLMESLLRAGHDVAIFDKQLSKAFPERCILGDVRDFNAFYNALEKADAVYHLAAEHMDNVRPISLYYDVNVCGASNLINIAIKRDIKKIFFTSTVALYGLDAGIPDESAPLKPFNDYSRSKLDAESVFKAWAIEDQQNSLIIMRPAVIFGANNRGNVYNLLKQIASKSFLMIGNGQNCKSMGYVLNLVTFMTEILNVQSGIHIYNYADKPDLTTSEIVDIAFKYFRKDKSVKHIPYFIGLAAGYCFDMCSFITRRQLPISSIRVKKFCANTQVSAEKIAMTGFKAPYSLVEGLRRMLEKEFT